MSSGREIFSFKTDKATVSFRRIWEGGKSPFEFLMSMQDGEDMISIVLKKEIKDSIVNGFNEVATCEGADSSFVIYEESMR